VSDIQMTGTARNDTGRESEGFQQMDDRESETLMAPPSTVAREPTGDDAVDDVLLRLDAAIDEPLDYQIEAGEHVQQVLQARLADLGKE